MLACDSHLHAKKCQDVRFKRFETPKQTSDLYPIFELAPFGPITIQCVLSLARRLHDIVSFRPEGWVLVHCPREFGIPRDFILLFNILID